MAARRAPYGHLLLPAGLAATSALAATVWIVAGDRPRRVAADSTMLP